MSSKSESSEGPLIRLWGVHSSQLPAQSATGDDLRPFLSSVLQEALGAIKSFPTDYTASPSSPSSWAPGPVKKFPHSDGPVQIYTRTVSAEALRAVAEEHHPPGAPDAAGSIRPESWALRHSVHQDTAAPGSASWDEFVRCFKRESHLAIPAFTPGVATAARWSEWDCGGVEVEADGDTWEDWTMCRQKETHKLPAPLTVRDFPVVQVTAAARGRRDFLVVQIAAQDDGEAGGAETKGRGGSGHVRAAFTSVERVRELSGERIEWTMGTVSDARGVLPAWVQRMATPGQIAKDVDMFLKWAADERKKEGRGFLKV